MRGKDERLGGREMFCDLNYRQDEGALEGTEKGGETTFQRIGQRQGCEEKRAICLYTVETTRRRSLYLNMQTVR